jgi:hypothetical protein
MRSGTDARPYGTMKRAMDEQVVDIFKREICGRRKEEKIGLVGRAGPERQVRTDARAKHYQDEAGNGRPR